jgi:hypothetical protein
MRKSLGLIPRTLRSGKFLAGVALVVALLVLPSGAHADTLNIVAQVDGGPTMLIAQSFTGFVAFTGTVGAFTFNSITGVGSPNLAEPALSTTSLNVQSAPGSHVLNVWVSQQDLTSPTGVNAFLSSFTSQSFSGGVTSVVEQTFIDNGNGQFGGTLLASSTFLGIGSNSSVNNTPPLVTPYSETVEYTITTSGFGNVNDTIEISAPSQPVPEPSTLLLAGSAVGALLLLTKRRGACQRL